MHSLGAGHGAGITRLKDPSKGEFTDNRIQGPGRSFCSLLAVRWVTAATHVFPSCQL